MLFIGAGDGEETDAHEGYVAGIFGDRTVSDQWTDVLKHPDRTFLAFVAACECGWRGSATAPATPGGYAACQESWLRRHFGRLPVVEEIVRRTGRPLRLEADFLLGRPVPLPAGADLPVPG